MSTVFLLSSLLTLLFVMPVGTEKQKRFISTANMCCVSTYIAINIFLGIDYKGFNVYIKVCKAHHV
jgi:hypothetical protein